MIIYKNLTIIGTSHISPKSVAQVKEFIMSKTPEIIALELDKIRAEALFAKKKGSSLDYFRYLGFKAGLFGLLGSWIENKLSKITGVKPGSEMKIAIKLVRENSLKIVLIDQDIRITLNKLSKRFTLLEKLRIIQDLLSSLFKNNPKIKMDLKNVPEQKIIIKIMAIIKKRYPSLYKTVIHERDLIMAKNLYNLIQDNKNKKILAVVGAGHQEQIIKKIKSLEKYEKE